VTNTQSEKNK